MPARIFQSYTQVIPTLIKGFEKTISKDINAAFKAANLEGVSESLDSAMAKGTSGPKTKKALGDFEDEAKKSGKKAGESSGDNYAEEWIKSVEDSLDHAFKNGLPIDESKIIADADRVGKKAGERLGSQYRKEVEGTSSPTLPAPDIETSELEGEGDKAAEHFLVGFAGGLTGSNGISKAVAGSMIAVGVGASIVGGIKKAVEFNKGNRELQASLGLTPEEAKKISNVTRQLYADAFGDSIETVEDATEAVVGSFANMRQASEPEISAITAKFLSLSDAMEVDTVEAAQAAGQMVRNGFASSSEDAVNMLIAAFRKVSPAMRGELLPILSEYSGHLRGVGLSGEAAMTLLARAAESGGAIGIDKIGDALKETSILMTAQSDDLSKALQSMGLDSGKIAKGFATGGKEAAESLDAVVKGLLKIEDPVKRVQTSILAFGTPFEDLGIAGVTQTLESLNNLENGLGNTQEVAQSFMDVFNKGLDADGTSVLRNIELIMVEIFEPLAKEAIPLLQDALAWVKANKQEIVDFFIQMGTAIGAVVKPALDFVVPLLKDVFNFITTHEADIAAAIPIILGVAGAFMAWNVISGILAPIAGLVGLLQGATVAAGGFGIAAAASTFGVGALVLAVGALGYAIGSVISDLINGTEGPITAWARSIADAIAKPIVDGMVWLQDSINAIIGNITGQMGTVRLGIFGVDLGRNKPKMAAGGDVLPTNGNRGVDVTLAEAGKAERVIDVGVGNANLKSQTEMNTEILNYLKNSNGGNQQPIINIYQQPGQDPRELVDILLDRLAFEERR